MYRFNGTLDWFDPSYTAPNLNTNYAKSVTRRIKKLVLLIF